MSDVEFPWLIFIPMLAMFALVAGLMFRKGAGLGPPGAVE